MRSACLNYREFDLENDLAGVHHRWFYSGPSFIKLLKLVLGELNREAMNNYNKKCVGLHGPCVSKRTVSLKTYPTL